MELVNNPFQACREIILKPNKVFATLRTKDNWSWIPFLLTSFFSILSVYLYLNHIDIEWYREFIIQITAGNLSPNEQKAMREMLQPNTLLFSLSFGMVFKLILFNAIMAAYLFICCKADEECIQGYTDWFGFCWWINLPLIIVSLLGCILISLSSSEQLSQLILEPTSLAYLFSAEIGTPLFGFLESLRLEYIWIIYLTIVGISQWTHFSKNKIYTIAIAPYAVIWGLWLIALLF